MTDFERPAPAGASSRPARRRSRRAAGPPPKGQAAAAQTSHGGSSNPRGRAADRSAATGGNPGRSGQGSTGAAAASGAGPKPSASGQPGGPGGSGPAAAPSGGRKRRRRGRGRGRGRGPGGAEQRNQGTSSGTQAQAGTQDNPSAAGGTGTRHAGKPANKSNNKPGGRGGKQNARPGVNKNGKPGQRGGRNQQGRPNQRKRGRGPSTLRTTRETSAGGLVVRGLAEAIEPGADPSTVRVDDLEVALIGRLDRRGRMLWSMPKGHVEPGETHAQTARREVLEETGLNGTVLAALGSIDYWFVADGKRIHKTVHHHLIRYDDGQLCDEDPEITEVAWVPFKLLPMRLAYEDERRLMDTARELLPGFAAGERDGTNPQAQAAAPVDPRRREAGRAALEAAGEDPRPLSHQKRDADRARNQAESGERRRPPAGRGESSGEGEVRRNRRRRRGRGRGRRGKGGPQTSQGGQQHNQSQPGESRGGGR